MSNVKPDIHQSHLKNILFATSSPIKVRFAQKTAQEFDIEITQTHVEVPEIQAEDGSVVARDKAEKIFALVKQPVVVSDDSWLIPGLNNFPGPYMKSINAWFTAEDWLRLTLPLADRTIILRQFVVYQDAHVQKLFYTDINAILLKEIRGKAPYPHLTLVSYDGGKTSAGEAYALNKTSSVNQRTSWHDLCEWLVAEEPAAKNKPMTSQQG